MEMKDSTSNDIWEQLIWLKEMTKRTGMLHSAQTLQMNVWPRVLFDSLASGRASVDTFDKAVCYNLELSKQEPDQERLCGVLSQYTKRLLGSDWVVSVEVKSPDTDQTFTFAGDDSD